MTLYTASQIKQEVEAANKLKEAYENGKFAFYYPGYAEIVESETYIKLSSHLDVIKQREKAYNDLKRQIHATTDFKVKELKKQITELKHQLAIAKYIINDIQVIDDLRNMIYGGGKK